LLFKTFSQYKISSRALPVSYGVFHGNTPYETGNTEFKENAPTGFTGRGLQFLLGNSAARVQNFHQTIGGSTQGDEAGTPAGQISHSAKIVAWKIRFVKDRFPHSD
jgi:hypothetical protein